MSEIKIQNQRLSMAQKNAKDKQWYKDRADELDNSHGNLLSSGQGQVSEYKRMKVNYDLFNNILNIKDFSYVCNPQGDDVGELPASMVNRDISSGKIKAILGMEMKRPFSWKVVATNPEATTRREQAEFGKIRDFVISEIMKPIRQDIEIKYQTEGGKKISEEEKQKIAQKVAQETKAATPGEVKKYMEREHQDPAEVLHHQLLEYLIKKCNVKKKFNTAFKHMNLSAKEIMYVGILNGEPEVWNVNSMRFNCNVNTDTSFVEDAESASCEYRMTPSQVVGYLGDELTNKQIDQIYTDYSQYNQTRATNSEFNFGVYVEEENNTVRVLHCVWKSLRKLKFLTFLDENGDEQTTIVNEKYELNPDAGDIEIEEEWIPEVYETWKVNADIYVNMRPVPGQFKDLDNLYHCKLPYYGAICDNMNSIPTSPMDRLKQYQYYFNIVMYRLELLLASDKGKKVMMNINAIPDSAGIDLEKWQYFFESSPFMWYDSNEEGMEYNDVNTMAKTIDLSLASDIGKYVEFAEYLKRQAGASVGITEAVEGQASSSESVGNNRQNLIQTSHILEPYFELHNNVKKNVLQALIECAKVAYAQNKPKKLHYVLDDMSRQVIDMDLGLLDATTIGIFVSNSSKAQEALDAIKQLGHAAMQNQKAELSDIASLLRQEGIVEAEETLKAAERERKEIEANAQASQQEALAQEEEKKRQRAREEHEEAKEIVILKEEEKRKTVVVQASIMGASFNPDMDKDNDGVNDFIEIARDGVNAEIQRDKNQLEREKFEQSKIEHKDKVALENKKISSSNAKKTAKS